MNERIKELAQEVFSFKYKTDPNELNPGHHMDHLHKFAELIVRECERVILAESATVEVGGDVDNAWKMGMDCSVRAIKEHFGVK